MRPVAPVLADAKWISETAMAEPGQNERELTLMSRNGQLREDFWARRGGEKSNHREIGRLEI
jgi:hypothetical protein